jgi:hypothetical protein
MRYTRNLGYYIAGKGAGIAHSVQRLARSWTAEGFGVRVPVGQDFSPLNIVQTG